MNAKILKEKIAGALKKMAREERGMALLFTLGMLGLLLALALAFASSALSERKSSSAANSQVVANMLARSALSRVIGAMNWYTQSGVSMSDFFSHASSSDVNANTFDWLWKVAQDSLTPYTSSYSAASGTTWQYVTNNTGDANQEIIGRFAYMLSFGSGGKLDPSACIDTTANEYGGGSSHSNVFGWELRRGVNVSEINLMNLNAQTNNYDYLTTTNGTNISFAANGGALSNGSRWLDFDTMFSAIGVTDSTKKSQLKSVFQLGSVADPEAFWLDTNGDGTKDPSKYYHRFNLQRGNWSSTNTAGWPTDSTSLSARQTFFNTLLTPSLQYTSSSDGAGGGITWLANWTSAGEMGSVNACKCQIAANLMDYCGSGSIVTSGDSSGALIDPSTWSDTVAPAFIGHKKTPMLNEVDVEVNCAIICSSYTNAGTTKYKFIYTLLPSFNSELIDLYGGAQDSSTGTVFTAKTSTATVKATVYYSCLKADGTYSAEESQDISLTQTFPSSWSSGYCSNKTTWTTSSITHTESGFTDMNTQASVKVRVQIKKPAILNYGGNNVNYCVIEDPANLNTVSLGVTNITYTSSKTGYFSFQCDDPRMNLMSLDWVGPAAITPGNNDASNTETIGLSNKKAVTFVTRSSNGTGDLENGSLDNYAPAYNSNNNNQHLCSAFVRNGVYPSAFSSEPIGMLAPCELGCIHRGARWQTLNLSVYRDVSSAPTAGGADYASGDANILDQVKFTSAASTYGKVNLNTSVNKVLQALFANLFLANTGNNNDSAVGVSRYFNPVTIRTGTTYGQWEELSAAATLASNFISARGSFPDGVLKTRTQMLTSGTTLRSYVCRNLAGPKCVNEQFVCDFINLTKAEPDQTTLVVVAQAIKDVGIAAQSNGTPQTAGGFTVYKDWNSSGDTSSANASSAGLIASGYKDYDGTMSNLPAPTSYPGYSIANCRKGVYENGADLITAERKFLVTLYYDSKNCKWRILSIRCCLD